MSLMKWAVGFLAFQVAVVILLIGIAPIFDSGVSYSTNTISASGINSSSTFSSTNLGVFSRFTYSVSNLDFPFNVIVFFPSIIGVLLIIFTLRGVA